MEVLREAAVHERFAGVLAAASENVMDEPEDLYDFDARLDSANHSGAASDVRNLFRRL